MQSKKIYYDCGCIGYVGSQGLYVRTSSCSNHKAISAVVRPPNTAIKNEILT